MKTKYTIALLACLLMGFMAIPMAIGQEEEAEVEIIYPFIDFNYLKDTDNQRILSARLYTADELSSTPFPGLTVKFYTNMENPELIGEGIRNEKGIASFIIPSDMDLPTDEENKWWFNAEFEGNERIEMTSMETSVLDVTLEMRVNGEGEGEKSVELEAYTIVDGEKVPVSDENIGLYVPRMFTLLTIEEGALEDGTVTFSFPDDIPGDNEGHLTVIGKFQNHWLYGNVEKRVETGWGVPSSHDVAETHRELWTQIAPWWMIITLTILLVGVWAHYMFAIISIIRIWLEGRKLKKSAN